MLRQLIVPWLLSAPPGIVLGLLAGRQVEPPWSRLAAFATAFLCGFVAGFLAGVWKHRRI